MKLFPWIIFDKAIDVNLRSAFKFGGRSLIIHLFRPYELSFYITVHQTAAAEIHGCLAQVFVRVRVYSAVAYDTVDYRKDQDGCFIDRDLIEISRGIRGTVMFLCFLTADGEF